MTVVRMVGIGCLLSLMGGVHVMLAAEDASAPAPAPAPAPSASAAPALPVSVTAPAPGPAVVMTAAPAAPSASDIARRHQRDRLEREIDRLQALISDLPSDLDQRNRELTAQRDDLGYEGWLIDAEGDQVRTSIDRLRVRLVLLEDITRTQDQLDRVRMVELQNALSDINTDVAHLSIAQRRAQEELTAITRQQAARQATFERLAEVHRQLDRLQPPAGLVVTPVPAGPRPPPAAQVVPSVPAAPPATTEH